ncbi:benzyl alcohol O-benzoyltransferase-like [Coffea arabica]|uniref:Benzyl alcohol O-benzoyltransferase n=1 Tax=Coffea arabica TaxID=13443 RepID=A0A6P6SQ41_COFAR|nr:benzyl alcohol O-benzoyltransferase-like [Coffea arabica]XP_027067991.1 benzyl alcohol O-benzoyltransferase-like [Coffea arabica]XP_027067992.1 benzyl alcohol O-benzoyltransferase-like [Coffea arabica]XP_027067993.1 benzyl alcohol O-benzoyltransferase-like [Coffea arabica]
MGSGSASSNSKKSLTFRVTRQKPELVRPAKSTPREFKLLSDIDDQEGLRTQLPAIHFYHNHNNDPRINGTRRRLDPVKVIREAIAKALVFYYPFAGRLREGPGRKLMVECTGEGVLFIEADADVTLEQFGDALQPPFPCLDELLYDVPHSGGILHCPLLLIQVTRLRCGGFIFAYRLNHTMADGAGVSQFMNEVGEIARGASAPSIQPVWQRELLNARDPPRVTCTHHEYDQVADTKGSIIPQDDMVHRSFFFGPAEISALRKSIPLDLSRKCSTFDVLTACLWRCRTIALQPEPNEEVRVMCIVNARSRFNPPLPQGYYGNVIAYPTALTTAGELCNKPVGYAVELVTKLKRVVTEDYMRSVADLMVIKGRPHFTLVRTYLVSDGTRSRLTDVDFGWGKPVYGGPAKGTVASFHIPFKNKKGEEGRVVPIFLPGLAMDRFVSELKNLLLSNNVHRGAITDRSISVKSAL